MDINKTDMFEKFFNGFQEKFIESFKAVGEEKILVRILENQKASKEEYRTYFNCAWEFLQQTTIAEQQAKVEELQKRVDALEGILQKCLLHGIDSVVIEGSQATTMRDRIQQILDGEK